MSDTPRMDEAWRRPQRQGEGFVSVPMINIAISVSREGEKLERELTEALKLCDDLAGALERIDYCLSNVEDVIHGEGSDGITIARKIVIEAMNNLKVKNNE